MAGGRPTKYNEEMLARANEYLDNHLSEGDTVPTLVGLAYTLDVADETLTNWGNKHPEFLGTLQKVMQKQHKMLVANGLTGEYVAPITKLMMCNHGYSEKTENNNNNTTKSVNIEVKTPEEAAVAYQSIVKGK